MDYLISPATLSGSVRVPASKSVAHRAMICAALSNGTSVLKNVTPSEDVDATCAALVQMGAEISRSGDTLTIHGGLPAAQQPCTFDCRESGSTLRFLMPLVAALGLDATFVGAGRLPYRPQKPYLDAAATHGVSCVYPADAFLPLHSTGRLTAGVYSLAGDVSSQFVTGLLLALPLLDGDSELVFTTPPESVPYIAMTRAVMAQFGVQTMETPQGYRIPGKQQYHPAALTVEADYSQAAFFLVARALGNPVTVDGLPEKSLQGDEKIVEILANLCYNESNVIQNGFSVDARDIPDLVPILAVLGCFCGQESHIFGAKRLRMKESDRLASISTALNAVGGTVQQTDDGLLITPVSQLSGGTIDCAGDHRIAMSLAIAATRASAPIRLIGGDAVRKSYPAFYQDYNALGGIAHVIPME